MSNREFAVYFHDELPLITYPCFFNCFSITSNNACVAVQSHCCHQVKVPVVRVPLTPDVVEIEKTELINEVSHNVVCFIHEGVQRWRNADATRLYEWDGRHGEIEVYNNRGEHLGAADAVTGILVKPPKKGRTIDV